MVLTTLGMEEPASVRTALRFSQHWVVWAVMLLPTKVPSAVRGMAPEQ